MKKLLIPILALAVAIGLSVSCHGAAYYNISAITNGRGAGTVANFTNLNILGNWTIQGTPVSNKHAATVGLLLSTSNALAGGAGSSTTNFPQLTVSNAPTTPTNVARLMEVTNSAAYALNVGSNQVNAASNAAIAYASNTVNTASNALVTLVTNGDASVLAMLTNSVAAFSNYSDASYINDQSGTGHETTNFGGLYLVGDGATYLPALVLADRAVGSNANNATMAHQNGAVSISTINSANSIILNATNTDLGNLVYGEIFLLSRETNTRFYGTNSFDNSTNTGGTFVAPTFTNSLVGQVAVNILPTNGTTAAILHASNSTVNFDLLGSGLLTNKGGIGTTSNIVAGGSMTAGTAGFFMPSVDGGNAFTMVSRFIISGGGGDGIISFSDYQNANTFNRLIFGPATAAFPAWKRTLAGFTLTDGTGASVASNNLFIPGSISCTNGYAGPQRVITNAAAINTVQTNTGYGSGFSRKAEVNVDVVYTGAAAACRAESWISNSVAGWVRGPIFTFPALTALTATGTNSLRFSVGSGEHFYVTNIANCTAERTAIFEQ